MMVSIVVFESLQPMMSTFILYDTVKNESVSFKSEYFSEAVALSIDKQALDPRSFILTTLSSQTDKITCLSFDNAILHPCVNDTYLITSNNVSDCSGVFSLVSWAYQETDGDDRSMGTTFSHFDGDILCYDNKEVVEKRCIDYPSGFKLDSDIHVITTY